MVEKYTRLLVTKLSPSVHDRLKELAKRDRRTLSALSRIIIEDYIDGSENVSEKQMSNR
jgi:predicted DNA-binding protein